MYENFIKLILTSLHKDGDKQMERFEAAIKLAEMSKTNKYAAKLFEAVRDGIANEVVSASQYERFVRLFTTGTVLSAIVAGVYFFTR